MALITTPTQRLEITESLPIITTLQYNIKGTPFVYYFQIQELSSEAPSEQIPPFWS